jgi:hypothetical protein
MDGHFWPTAFLRPERWGPSRFDTIHSQPGAQACLGVIAQSRSWTRSFAASAGLTGTEARASPATREFSASARIGSTYPTTLASRTSRVGLAFIRCCGALNSFSATTKLMHSGPRKHSCGGSPTSHRLERLRYFAYLSAHALTPPASFINVFSRVRGPLQ